ncbi:MAG: hypothetical protein EOP87_13365 [Verrucomicrobiaceae bacterium]|nr:MAG: hypothetical protein EOP87_13365 [Verrucomicrobiaceae bacterium]
MTISRILTVERLKSYGMAVAQLIEILRAEEHGHVVVPSRGAHPFYSCAELVDLSIFGNKDRNLRRATYLPFTSDFGNASELCSASIRRYWVNLLVELVNGKQSGLAAFHNRLVDFVHRRFQITPGDTVVHHSGNGSRVVFIDTAVSGRAIAEIIGSFRECAFSDYLIILFKAERSGFRTPYREVIETEARQGRLRIIEVEELFSEDQSPLLNGGCTSVVFPNLIEEARMRNGRMKDLDAAGGGVYMLNATSVLHGSSYNGITGLMHHAIYRYASEWFESPQKWSYDEVLSDRILQLEKDLPLVPLEREHTLMLADHLIKDYGHSPTVSPSHVIRLDLTAEDIRYLV